MSKSTSGQRSGDPCELSRLQHGESCEFHATLREKATMPSASVSDCEKMAECLRRKWRYCVWPFFVFFAKEKKRAQQLQLRTGS
mmetsp:Transcript_32956/g.75923  ORF Transcript_32956/g.75923 Transcript_32956/m.75923 type:complete len:84 (+) Transcript_32956:904-1155(+)